MSSECRLLVGVLALLIGHAAAGLAGRLAGGLALAAAAVLRALAHVAGLERLDSFHNPISHSSQIGSLPGARQARTGPDNQEEV